MDLIGKFTKRNDKKSKAEKTVRFEPVAEVTEIPPYADDLKPVLWYDPNVLRQSLDSDIQENKKRDASKTSATSATTVSPDTPADDYTWRGLEHVLRGERKTAITSRQVHVVVDIYQGRRRENGTVSKSAIKMLAKAYSKQDRLLGIALAKQDRREVDQMLRDSKLSDVSSTMDCRRRRFLPFS